MGIFSKVKASFKKPDLSNPKALVKEQYAQAVMQNDFSWFIDLLERANQAPTTIVQPAPAPAPAPVATPVKTRALDILTLWRALPLQDQKVIARLVDEDIHVIPYALSAFTKHLSLQTVPEKALALVCGRHIDIGFKNMKIRISFSK